MLEKFGVLVLSEYLTESEKETSLRALANFYHSLTPKHKKRISINWVNGIEQNGNETLLESYDIPNNFIEYHAHSEKLIAMKESSLLLHPSSGKVKSLISDALSFGLPIISMNTATNKDYLDMTCSMLLEGQTEEQLVAEINAKIEMLYHDQAVLKFLKKGAYAQYENKFGWGLKQFRKSNH